MIKEVSNILSGWKTERIAILSQIGIFSFIFLWDLKYDYYQLRYLIVIPFLLILINLKNTQNNLLLKCSLPPLLILIHLFLTNISISINLDNRDILGILFLFIVFYVSFFYKNEIFNNLDKHINWFTSIFSISFILFFVLTNSKFILNCYNGWFFQTKFIFVENSHFALIAVPIINYYSLTFCKLKNFDKINKITFAFFIIFLIISFLNFSTTFLVGLIITNFYLLFFYKNNIKLKILSIVFILLSFFIIFNKSECSDRTIHSLKSLPQYFKETMMPQYFKETTLPKSTPQISNMKKKKNKL